MQSKNCSWNCALGRVLCTVVLRYHKTAWRRHARSYTIRQEIGPSGAQCQLCRVPTITQLANWYATPIYTKLPCSPTDKHSFAGMVTRIYVRTLRTRKVQTASCSTYGSRSCSVRHGTGIHIPVCQQLQEFLASQLAIARSMQCLMASGR